MEKFGYIALAVMILVPTFVTFILWKKGYRIVFSLRDEGIHWWLICRDIVMIIFGDGIKSVTGSLEVGFFVTTVYDAQINIEIKESSSGWVGTVTTPGIISDFFVTENGEIEYPMKKQ